MEISRHYIHPVVMETSGLQGQNIKQILPLDLYQTTVKIKGYSLRGALTSLQSVMQIQAVAAGIF